MTNSEKPKKNDKKTNNSLRERRKQARQKRKLKKKLEEKKRLKKLSRIYQGFSYYSPSTIEDKYREPIVLEKRARGVKKVIPNKACDECGRSPGKGEKLIVYYKTNVGEVAICDCCIDTVRERSGRYRDAFGGAFLGGGFSPR